jgi:nucleoside-diphosphate-sugar epimerase
VKVLVTGSQGFIGTYICGELLGRGYEVVGVDNFSKYGLVNRSHDGHPRFSLCREDVAAAGFIDIVTRENPDLIIAGAAMIGGISYFHKFAYDLLATNERILARTFDAAIKAHKRGRLRRIIVLSSSMVFERATVFPTPETALQTTPPPMSTYGFQKLASEYFAKGAWEQYGLPYTILRPFNCVGVGEDRALDESEITSGNVKLMMSHVLPDLVNKTLKGQDPLHIFGTGNQVRCYTNGKDLARGIRLAIESELAVNSDFNISTSRSTTVLELANIIWRKINLGKPFRYVSDEPFEYDVQMRIPDTEKAKKILGFEAEVTLEQSVDEVIDYMKQKGTALERSA